MCMCVITLQKKLSFAISLILWIFDLILFDLFPTIIIKDYFYNTNEKNITTYINNNNINV